MADSSASSSSDKNSSDDDEPLVPRTKPATTSAVMDVDIAKRRTVFVRGLPYSLTSDALSERFSFIAPLKHATIATDPRTHQSRGFGFVTFADASDAVRATKELRGTEIEGRRIKVEIAEPRHRKERQQGQAPKAKEEVKRRAPRLIVRNLPWSIKQPEQLEKVFRSYGRVKQVIIPKKHTGELRGFAIVTMKGYKNAQRAIERVNGREMDGRPVAVDWALEKEEYERRQKEVDSEDENGSDNEEAGSVGNDEETAGEESSSEEEGDDANQDERDGESNGLDSSEELLDEEDLGSASGFEGEGEDEDAKTRPPTDSSTTLFIRNLPFTTDDDALYKQFSQFGPVRYARTVIDHATDRPKGTGFVCFYSSDAASKCLDGAPTNPPSDSTSKHSLLVPESSDPLYTLEGRLLSITRAVDRSEAAKLASASASSREKANSDKRRLFLLKEGTISASSPLFTALPGSERALREQSLDQRRKLLQADPNLHLSLVRLSIRNIPRWVTDKDLKQFARQAIPRFVEQVKKGERHPLSEEELARDGEDGKKAEKERRKKGKGVVKQAKIQLEKQNGRSRGYGFIEYHSHMYALMGLRALNGTEVSGVPPQREDEGERMAGEPERKKRLIVEFAIENAKVVNRRRDQEAKSREIVGRRKREAKEEEEENRNTGVKRKRDSDDHDHGRDTKKPKSKKGKGKFDKMGERKDHPSSNRKLPSRPTSDKSLSSSPGRKPLPDPKPPMSQRVLGIIQKKRIMRRANKKGKA